MKIKKEIRDELKKYYENICNSEIPLEIISACELNQEQIKEIEKTIPFKSNKIVCSIDEKLMAGIIIQYGTKMIDLSLKTKLENLKQTLYERI